MLAPFMELDIYTIKKNFQNVFSFDSRKLTCFCPICMEDTESIQNCENINENYVKPWKHNEINLKGRTLQYQLMVIEFPISLENVILCTLE